MATLDKYILSSSFSTKATSRVNETDEKSAINCSKDSNSLSDGKLSSDELLLNSLSQVRDGKLDKTHESSTKMVLQKNRLHKQKTYKIKYQEICESESVATKFEMCVTEPHNEVVEISYTDFLNGKNVDTPSNVPSNPEAPVASADQTNITTEGKVVVKTNKIVCAMFQGKKTNKMKLKRADSDKSSKVKNDSENEKATYENTDATSIKAKQRQSTPHARKHCNLLNGAMVAADKSNDIDSVECIVEVSSDSNDEVETSRSNATVAASVDGQGILKFFINASTTAAKQERTLKSNDFGKSTVALPISLPISLSLPVSPPASLLVSFPVSIAESNDDHDVDALSSWPVLVDTTVVDHCQKTEICVKTQRVVGRQINKRSKLLLDGIDVADVDGKTLNAADISSNIVESKSETNGVKRSSRKSVNSDLLKKVSTDVDSDAPVGKSSRQLKRKRIEADAGNDKSSNVTTLDEFNVSKDDFEDSSSKRRTVPHRTTAWLSQNCMKEAKLKNSCKTDGKKSADSGIVNPHRDSCDEDETASDSENLPSLNAPASKDIRNFFAKAAVKAPVPPLDPLAASLVTVVADIHPEMANPGFVGADFKSIDFCNKFKLPSSSKRSKMITDADLVIESLPDSRAEVAKAEVQQRDVICKSALKNRKQVTKSGVADTVKSAKSAAVVNGSLDMIRKIDDGVVEQSLPANSVIMLENVVDKSQCCPIGTVSTTQSNNALLCNNSSCKLSPKNQQWSCNSDINVPIVSNNIINDVSAKAELASGSCRILSNDVASNENVFCAVSSEKQPELLNYITRCKPTGPCTSAKKAGKHLADSCSGSDRKKGQFKTITLDKNDRGMDVVVKDQEMEDEHIGEIKNNSAKHMKAHKKMKSQKMQECANVVELMSVSTEATVSYKNINQAEPANLTLEVVDLTKPRIDFVGILSGNGLTMNESKGNGNAWTLMQHAARESVAKAKQTKTQPKNNKSTKSPQDRCSAAQKTEPLSLSKAKSSNRIEKEKVTVATTLSSQKSVNSDNETITPRRMSARTKAKEEAAAAAAAVTTSDIFVPIETSQLEPSDNVRSRLRQRKVVEVVVDSDSDGDRRPVTKKNKKKSKKALRISSGDDDTEIEEEDDDYDDNYKAGKRHAKLAPLFLKRSAKEVTQSPVKRELTEAEKEALRLRQSFLQSGVPEELKRQQAILLSSMTAQDPRWSDNVHINQQNPEHISVGLEVFNRSLCYRSIFGNNCDSRVVGESEIVESENCGLDDARIESPQGIGDFKIIQNVQSGTGGISSCDPRPDDVGVNMGSKANYEDHLSGDTTQSTPNIVHMENGQDTATAFELVSLGGDGESSKSNVWKGIDPWNLTEVNGLKLRPSVDCTALNRYLVMTRGCLARLEQPHNERLGWVDVSRPDLTNEQLSAVLAEVQSRNKKFPVYKLYKKFLSKKGTNGLSNGLLKSVTSNVTKQKISSSMTTSAHGKKPSSMCAETDNAVMDAESKYILDDCEESQDNLTDDRGSMLWTEKYAPQHLSEVIGNQSSHKKLANWLRDWKVRIGREAANQKETQKVVSVSDDDSNQSHGSSNSSCRIRKGRHGSSDDDNDDEYLCNTVLLMGSHHGIGKTSTVYALAQQLGFKVFEVNPSMQRDGRYLLTQLQEATQSHQVSRNALMQPLGSQVKTMPFAATSSKTLSPAKLKTTIATTITKTSETKPKVSEKQLGFANLFRTKVLNASESKQSDNKNTVDLSKSAEFSSETKKNKAKSSLSVKSKHVEAATEKCKSVVDEGRMKVECFQTAQSKRSAKKVDVGAEKVSSVQKTGSSESTSSVQRTISSDTTSQMKSDAASVSLILFDEVDVVFGDDRGFWNAVETFLSTTKRPIILTASDEGFQRKFHANCLTLNLRPLPVDSIVSYLQLLCLVEANVRIDCDTMTSFVRSLDGDIRRCMLTLQYWVSSGGAREHAQLSSVRYFTSCLTAMQDLFLEKEHSKSSRDDTMTNAPAVSNTLICKATTEETNEGMQRNASAQHNKSSKSQCNGRKPMARKALQSSPEKMATDEDDDFQSLRRPLRKRQRLVTSDEEETICTESLSVKGIETVVIETLVDDITVQGPRKSKRIIKHPSWMSSEESNQSNSQMISAVMGQSSSQDSVPSCSQESESQSEIMSEAEDLILPLHTDIAGFLRHRSVLDLSAPRCQQNDRRRISNVIPSRASEYDYATADLCAKFNSLCSHDKGISDCRANNCLANRTRSNAGDRIDESLAMLKVMARFYDGISTMDSCHNFARGQYSSLLPGDTEQSSVVTDIRQMSDHETLEEARVREDMLMKLTLDSLVSCYRGGELTQERSTGERWPTLIDNLDPSKISSYAEEQTRLMSDVVTGLSIASRSFAALAVDYMPAVRAVCKSEDIRRSCNTKRRFAHHFGWMPLKSSIINSLAKPFDYHK